MNYVLVNSKNDNSYLYSFNKNQILLMHPLISLFLNLKSTNYDIEDWIEENVKKKIEIKGKGWFSKREVLYQYSKYLFLLKNGYFTEKEINTSSRYSGEMIKYELANTTQVSFEVTDRCNLSCDYCIYGKYYTNRTLPENIDFPIEKAKKILTDLTDLWNSSLHSSKNKRVSIGFYGGEPLLNMKFIREIVEHSKSLTTKHFNFSFNMTTNGVLLSRNIKFLAENKFSLLISIDGGTPNNNLHRKFKNGKPIFEKIYKNILGIRDNYPQYFEEFVNFNSVLHDKNSIIEILEFFQTEFGKRVNVSELDTVSVNPNLKNPFYQMYKKTSESINESDKSLPEIGMERYVGIENGVRRFIFGYSGFVKFGYLDLLFDYRNKRRLPTATCQPFSRKIFITARGQVLPCERIGHQYAVGTLNEEGLFLQFDEIAKKHNKYLDHISIKQCKDCYLAGYCSICMFREEIDSEEIECSDFTDRFKFENTVSEKLSIIEKNPVLYSDTLRKLSYD